MAFAKRHAGPWENSPSTATPIDATTLTAYDDALLALFSIDPATSDVPVWDGSKFAPGKLTAASIGTSAGIAKSQLAPLGIVDADIAPDANIDPTKIAGGGGDGGGGAPSELPGVIKAYGGGSAPSGYLFCDGSAVSRTTYADLFAAIGTNYGVGDNSSTFNIPDGRGRDLIGRGSNANIAALGANEGQAESARQPWHNHDLSNHTHYVDHTHTVDIGVTTSFDVGNVPRTDYGSPGTYGTSASSAPNSGGPSTNLSGWGSPAFLVVNFIIKT